MTEEDCPESSVRACDIRGWETVENEEEVELTIAEESEEGEHIDLSLFENNKDIERSPVAVLQGHQTQHKEQETTKRGTCLIPSTDKHQRLHVFQDPFTGLLKSPAKEIRVASTHHGFWCCLESSFPMFFCLLKEGLRRIQGRSQLLDWLH